MVVVVVLLLLLAVLVVVVVWVWRVVGEGARARELAHRRASWRATGRTGGPASGRESVLGFRVPRVKWRPGVPSSRRWPAFLFPSHWGAGEGGEGDRVGRMIGPPLQGRRA